MKISVLVLDGVFDTGLSCMLDCFSFANGLAPQVNAALAPCEVQVVGLRRRVVTHLGMCIAPTRIDAAPTPDILLVPALYIPTPARAAEVMHQRETGDAASVMADYNARGIAVGTACSGTFFAAKAGILDGRRATTAWWLAPTFRQMFPKVMLDETQMLVDAGPVVTAGGGFGHLNLSLWLLRRRSPAWATMAARYLVVDTQPLQAPYIIPDHLSHSDPLVEQFEGWVRAHMAEPFSLAQAARSLGASARSLQRRVQMAVGKSPVSMVQDLRLEQAVHLLRSEREGIDSIAAKVGYANGVTLRNLIRRKFGRGVRELRAALV